MSIRTLAKDLQLSPTRIAQLLAQGMPTDPGAARKWRLEFVNARKGSGPPNVVPIEVHDVAGDLAATLARLREQERLIAGALTSLIKEGRLSEAASLRRDHISVVKGLFDAESRAIKIAESRGQLIRVEVALNMISASLAEPILMLRQLPNIAQTPQEKARLETCVNGILSTIRDGAEQSLRERKASYG